MARTYHGFFPVKTLNGAPPLVQQLPLVVGTYYEGNVLRFNATTGSATKANATGTAILGVIGANVTRAQSSSDKYPVYLNDGNTVFQARVIATGAAKLRLFDKCDLAVASTYNFRVQGTASTEVFTIVDVHPDDAASTATGNRYWVVGNTKKAIIDQGHNTI